MSKLTHRMIAAFLRVEHTWKQKNTRLMTQGGTLLLCVVVGVFVFVQPTFAQDVLKSTIGSVDWIILHIASFAMYVAQALTQIIVALLDIVIHVMMYNGFASSPVVGAGWSIVRDAVNMFFVIILIFIAVGTIFGHKRFQWSQQVPRLLIFALVINFSRTLCAIMIDFGQVIMLTFANALRQIAAGNFIQMLGLNEIYAISTSTTLFENIEQGSTAAESVNAFDWFAAGLAAVFMVVVVLATVIALAAILVWRIVTLWVLIVMAPLAWFFGGVADVVGKGGKVYADWWNKFTCAVAIGPVLTFFLWLTLAVAGAGNIAAKGGFVDTTQAGGINVSGNINQIFEFDNLLSFILGIAMLMAGFEAASDICSSGFVTSALGKAKGSGTAAAKMAAGAATYVGSGAARWTGRGVRAAGAAGVRELGGWAEKKGGPVGWATKRGRAKLYRNIAKKSPLGEGIVGRMVGQKLDVAAEELEKGVVADVREPMKKWEGVGKDAKFNQLQRYAKEPPKTAAGKREAMALLQEALADSGQRKKLEASGQLGQLWGSYGKDMKEMYRHDPDTKKRLKDFEKTRPDITGKLSDVDSWEKAKGLDDSALADESVVDHLKGLETNIRTRRKRLDDDGNVMLDDNGNEMTEEGFLTAWEAIEKGQAGTKKKSIAKQIGELSEGLEGEERANAIKGIAKSELLGGMTSATDLSHIPEEEIMRYVNAGAVAKNGALSERVLASRNIGTLPERNRDAVIAAAMKKSGGLDLATGTVSDAMTFRGTVNNNPQLLGVMNQDAMRNITGNTETLGTAADALTSSTLKQAVAAIKRDPRANAALHRNISQIFAAAKNEVNPEDLGRITSMEDMFDTQIASSQTGTRRSLEASQDGVLMQQSRVDAANAHQADIDSRRRALGGAAGRGSPAEAEAAQAELAALDQEEARLAVQLTGYEEMLTTAQERVGELQAQLQASVQPKIDALGEEKSRVEGQIATLMAQAGVVATEAVQEEIDRYNTVITELEAQTTALTSA